MFNRKLKARIDILEKGLDNLTKDFTSYRNFISQKSSPKLPDLMAEYEKFTGNAIRHVGYDRFRVESSNVDLYSQFYAHELTYKQLKCDVNTFKAAELDKLKKGEV
jgi:hypothetical protein